MNTRERHILDTAIAALVKTAGIKVHLRTALNGDLHDVIIQIEAERRGHRFSPEIKTVDRFETPAMIMAQAKGSSQRPLLVAPYVSRAVAERCRQLGQPFIDTAGNAYLEAPGLFVYIAGQARPAETRAGKYQALNAAGLKLMFALLCHPELLNENYRKIATDVGVALGTVSSGMRDLDQRGFFNLATHPAKRKLLDPERMLKEWVTHYPVTLRPKLNPRRFKADIGRLQEAGLPSGDAFWGGEPAAEKLTRYLKPEHFTIYYRGSLANLVAAGHLRAAENGHVEVLDVFWNFDPGGEFPDVVPPILVYADLLATHDSRNVETARMIYEQRIEPAFHPRT